MLLGRAKPLILQYLPPRVAERLRSWRARLFKPRIVVHNYGSGPLSIYLSDPLAKSWYDHDWAELPEITQLRRSRLRRGARVFNLGAHQGLVAMMLAREVGAKGTVIAVEPNPHNAHAAEKNCGLNDINQIEVLVAAVADHSGAILFNGALNGQLDDGTGAGGSVEVKSVTINELVEKYGHPDVVYLDVEGAEGLALAAGSSILDRKTDVFLEVHVGCGLERLGSSVDRVFSFFPPDCYETLGAAEGERSFRPVNRDDPITRHRFFLIALPRDIPVSP